MFIESTLAAGVVFVYNAVRGEPNESGRFQGSWFNRKLMPGSSHASSEKLQESEDASEDEIEREHRAWAKRQERRERHERRECRKKDVSMQLLRSDVLGQRYDSAENGMPEALPRVGVKYVDGRMEVPSCEEMGELDAKSKEKRLQADEGDEGFILL